MTTLPPPISVALALLTLVAGLFDLRVRRIPNRVTMAGLAAGLVLQVGLFGLPGLKDAALGLGLALLIHLPLFALHITGGGDVKLMAAVGALSGPHVFLVIFLASAVLGGLFALISIIFGGRLRGTLRNIVLLVKELVALKPPHRDHPELDVANPAARTVPRGVIVLLATAAVLLANNL